MAIDYNGTSYPRWADLARAVGLSRNATIARHRKGQCFRAGRQPGKPLVELDPYAGSDELARAFCLRPRIALAVS